MLNELETFVALADQRGRLAFGSKMCQHLVFFISQNVKYSSYLSNCTFIERKEYCNCCLVE